MNARLRRMQRIEIGRKVADLSRYSSYCSRQVGTLHCFDILYLEGICTIMTDVDAEKWASARLASSGFLL